MMHLHRRLLLLCKRDTRRQMAVSELDQRISNALQFVDLDVQLKFASE
jgi:hypothetical protein